MPSPTLRCWRRCCPRSVSLPTPRRTVRLPWTWYCQTRICSKSCSWTTKCPWWWFLHTFFFLPSSLIKQSHFFSLEWSNRVARSSRVRVLQSHHRGHGQCIWRWRAGVQNGRGRYCAEQTLAFDHATVPGSIRGSRWLHIEGRIHPSREGESVRMDRLRIERP